MFAAISRQKDCAVSFTASATTQNVLLVNAGRPEGAQWATLLGDNYRLFQASGEHQLFNILEQQPVQLIIIYGDGRRAIDGLQICTAVKSSAGFAHLPVIQVIPANDHQARIACLRCGSDACLELPLSSSLAKAQIENLLANRLNVKLFHTRSLMIPRNPGHVSRHSETFLAHLGGAISDNLHNSSLDVHVLAKLLNISRPTLYRKIRRVCEHTPNELIIIFRLQKAAELLSTGSKHIAEIARSVGFNSRSNFGKAFIKYLGVTPTIYRRTVKVNGSTEEYKTNFFSPVLQSV